MAEIKDYVDVQVLLQTPSITPQGFGLELFLVDDDQIPVDTRYRYTTADDYDSDFTSDSEPYKFGQVFFGQALKPDNLMVGRWISAASSPYFIWGSGYETDFSVWELITDGEFGVIDDAGTPNRDDITGLDFDAITSFAQVLTILNTALAAIGTPNITGLDSAEFKIDSLGRVVLEMPTTGSTAAKITITTVATPVGTDVSSKMDATNGSSIAGYDVETPQEALAAISELDDTYYNIAIRGGTKAILVSLASYVETKEKLLDLVTNDADVKNPAVTDDLASQIQDLSLTRTMVIYTEKTTEYPDAGIAGRILPESEGTVNWCWTAMALVTDSGLLKSLTSGERIALEAKQCNYVISIQNNVTLFEGITSGNVEKRIMQGRDWFIARIREALYADLLIDKLQAFDNETLTKVEQRISEWAEEAIDRRILVDTVERPFTVNLPDADDIDAIERATHKLTVTDAFTGYLNSAINTYQIIGQWTN